MHDPIADLEKLALAQPADSLLLVAPADHRLSKRLQAAGGAEPSDAHSLLAGMPDKRYKLALIAEYLDRLPKKAGQRLIASLRDLHAESLYCLTDPMVWSVAEMLALGLEPVHLYPLTTGQLMLYRFDLYDYKRTPDWLNARHWANPERWEKARW